MFEKFAFTSRQIDQYYKSAARDLKIAQTSDIPEVIFKFSYDALLKLAIAVCAKNNLRVKSRQGHQAELINKLSEIIKEQDIIIIGQEMRAKRNWDLYGGGALISKKEADEFLSWTKKIFAIADVYLYKRVKLI
ncbi:MAG: hypothetical protein UU95_C0002G0027 [Parcubacteria group bacterium GW2011_GWC2_42_12]|uniref:HEPN domain-containing protein n=2 Tax=Candidatus Falkowiibacteriota TaxID=1752728 RepID=A0A1F5S6X7_9BACT|nr:MAG: hypothetical protein UU43_C0005G0005 [Candidatus Falkowbacteria bacterium GW2011_GWA2_41_14]KKS35321.1 MAG: hypothetical protein UU95_C0002G0027 [Parcubacteria group bacterium GW2011_GWC2_42_12]OGF22429.1 MAG: hypothetical protein A3D45_00045 [Candidatus Falkowbacteria bacterium RIFCSPHIGHO2_02_FULL_42_9]